MTTTATFTEHAQANAEGWGIFHTGEQNATHNLYELQRIDEDDVFSSDDDAIKFVVDEAIKHPKGIHADALLFLAYQSPNEIDNIIRSAVSKETFAKLKEVMRYTEFDKF